MAVLYFAAITAFLLGAEGYSFEEVQRADYNTNCGLGFAGLQCTEVVTCEALDYCSGHGACVRGGRCVCDPGWRGAGCGQSDCPSNCSGHGSCAASGGCVCDAGYGGVVCGEVQCLGGGNCTGHGACLSGGLCACEQGYVGAACDAIDVAQKCSNHGQPPGPPPVAERTLTGCEGAGYPDVNGNCECDLWFTGPDCSLALCLNNCSGHGACDTQTGRCWCDRGWSAGDCGRELCASNCSGHGSCFRGVCACQEGYQGHDCALAPCQSGCSGHGACANGTCACDPLWGGAECGLALDQTQACPGNCSARGSCLNGTCLCDRGWAGPDCGAAVPCAGNCSGRGLCLNATCQCDQGFSGPDCATPHCPNNCTLRGACTVNGTCACDPGRYGADCSLAELDCGTGPGANCSGHGSCVDPGRGQWWSGSGAAPDLWGADEESGHWARRDVGGCEELHSAPLLLSPRAASAELPGAGQRVLSSNGVPDHVVATPPGLPLCEVPWRLALPLHPERAPARSAVPAGGVVGLALNGVPVLSAELSDGSNAVEGPQRTPCYGHAAATGMWHYHHPLLGCAAGAGPETLLGFALDGFPIHGPLPGDKAAADAALDPCNGRQTPDGRYRYHVRTLAQVDERGGPDQWRYVLGCFAGTPVTSLGLRQTQPGVALPGGAAGGSLAEQLGLVGRVGVCVCDAGWAGGECGERGCSNNCTGHGVCEATAGAAQCVCDAGWEGEGCEVAANSSCAGCSGHGACLWPDHLNASCLCDPGWHGPSCETPAGGPCAVNCSGHGACSNGTCVCDAGYVGAACAEPVASALNLNTTLCWQWLGGALTNNSCSGHGACVNGSCLCDLGWSGLNCSAQAVSLPAYLPCPHNCSRRGACVFSLDPARNTFNGTCACDPGFDGPDCSLDWGARLCAGNCSAHGTCVNSTCLCDAGWTGLDCTKPWVSSVRLCPLNCSGHGACVNGSCACDAGWWGANCSLPLACPGDCSGHGACLLGNCSCDPGWAGPDCGRAASCPGFLPLRGVNCSGHGVCVDGNCSCDLEWGGPDCSVQGCPASCSGNGRCVNGTCACHRGFIGLDCGRGPYGGECPGGCSGHGACAMVAAVPLPGGVADVRGDGILSGAVGCVCDEGWRGPDCTVRACPADCSGNGACAQNGSCFCYRNWGGEDCGTAACPNGCSDHGTCVGGEGCLCDVGYQGVDCGVSACANNCSMHGVCVQTPGDTYGDNLGELGHAHAINASAAGCLCFYGWGGQDCSELACPLNCSFPQGQCTNGTCVCDLSAGFYGRNCSEQFGLVELRADGQGLVPSFGIFRGGTAVTVKGAGFVDSDTMRCKFGDAVAPATLVQPTPPELPFATCRTPARPAPGQELFTFSLDGNFFTEADARLQFQFHGSGQLTAVRWPTGPEQGGTTVEFRGMNLQYANAVQCGFGSFVVAGSSTVLFVDDPDNPGQQLLEGRLRCPVPALSALALPASAGATVDLSVTMEGTEWMVYSTYPFFRYFGASFVSPSFGPQQDQQTQLRVFGFNLWQGEEMQTWFPGFSHAFACVFHLPWEDQPVQVASDVNTWLLVTAPIDAATFACSVPPGLAGPQGYLGPVEVGISLNPCLYDPADTEQTGPCIGSFPFTVDNLQFWYADVTIDALSVTLGPTTGGTLVTVSGNDFERRDLTALPSGYQHLPVLCRFGDSVTEGSYLPAETAVLCTAPACGGGACGGLELASCPACLVTVPIEVALNGQDYTNSLREFGYVLDPVVRAIEPTLGPILGGTAITVTADGFHDPCQGCAARGDCGGCGALVSCQFAAFTRVAYTNGTCLRLPDGTCDPQRVVCEAPLGRELRGNVVSLDPFNVAVSVSLNRQQYFPLDVLSGVSYNVYDARCSATQVRGCAFNFKYYELPVILSVLPSVVPGTGGGRITLTGSNFLNENRLACRIGPAVGDSACTAGATGTFVPCQTAGCCEGATGRSAIFVDSTTVICPTYDMTPPDGGDPPLLASVGVSLNLGGGPFDTSFLLGPDNQLQPAALRFYWALSATPTLGFAAGGTRVTVSGLNFDVVGSGGDSTQMRCLFGSSVVAPSPTSSPDPVEFRGGMIECSSPSNQLAGAAPEDVWFGVCLIGVDCIFTGPSAQAADPALHPAVNHFTGGLQFHYYAAPVLSVLSPNLGPRTGGTVVSISGSGFFAAAALGCRFDLGHFSTAASFLTSSRVACETPAISSGSYNLQLTLNGQDYSAGCGGGECVFGVYTEPGVVEVRPQTGVNSGATVVQLTMQSFIPNYQSLRCRFFPVAQAARDRLAAEGLTLEVGATLAGSTVSCTTPSTLALSSGQYVLRSPTAEAPDRGLVYVLVTWNGQQFGPADPSTQRFWFHDAVTLSAISPQGGRTSVSQPAIISGLNFVDTPSLVVQFGSNLFMCAPGAPASECPEDDTHQRDAAVFLDAESVQITVPTSAFATRKTVRVSNNNQEFSQTTVEYQYYLESEACPNACRGRAGADEPGHGVCREVGSGGLQCECNLGYSGIDCSVGPEVLRLSPSIGLASGGFTVTVFGRNIAAGSDFTYRALMAGVTVTAAMPDGVTQNQLQFQVPAIGAFPAGVAVEVSVNGEDYTNNQVLLVLVGTPTVTALLPDGAHYSGGSLVTLTGANFVDSAELTVQFGSLAASQVLFLSTSRVVATSPPCAAQCRFGVTQAVSVSLNGAEYYPTSAGFQFVDDTALLEMAPTLGATSGGTPVVLTATNMNATNGFACRFGDVTVAGTFLTDSSKLLCAAPAVEAEVSVPVTLALDGQVFSAAPSCERHPRLCFHYKPPITIDAVFPTSGPVQGGTPLTISGSGFYNMTVGSRKCRFGSVEVPMRLVDASRFACASPPGSLQLVDLAVAANGVDFVPLPSQFAYFVHPVLIATTGDTLLPIGSPVLGGTTVTITGSGFVDSGDGIVVRWRDPDSGTAALSQPAAFVSAQVVVVLTVPFPLAAYTEVSVSLNGGLQFSDPAADTFVYYDQPDLQEVVPFLGPRLGETAVVLMGLGLINLRGVARCRFGSTAVQAVYDDAGGDAVLLCRTPPWPEAAWVTVELALDGQVFTTGSNVKFQYHGEYDVFSASPSGGPIAGGTQLTVVGVGFFLSGNLLTCFFGDGAAECSVDVAYPCYKPVRATYLSPTRVGCVSPSMPRGGDTALQYPIRVGLNGQFLQACPNVQSGYQCALKAALTFTYYDDVYVTGILPNSGQVQGGTRITVSGRNFRVDLRARTACILVECSADDVYTSGDLLGQLRPGVERCSGQVLTAEADGVLDSTRLVCRAPLAANADSHFAQFDVSLNRGATYQGLYGPVCQDGCPTMFYYYTLPDIGSLRPCLGPITGGTTVTVIGVGFIGQQNTQIRCRFGSVESTQATTGVPNPVAFVTDSAVSCVAPAQAEGGVRVQLSLNGLDADFTAPELGAVYNYYSPPTLTGVPVPSAGPTDGGTVITITGSGFRNGELQCLFWTTPAAGGLSMVTDAVFISESEASCPTPAVPQSQLVSISISLNAQDFSPFFLQSAFFYFPSPEVQALLPRGGPAESGGSTVLRGVGFLDTSYILCRVGVLEAAAVFLNSTHVRCAVPQIQPKAYSAAVLGLGAVTPQVLPDSFVAYPVQDYPVEVSFDGQIFSSSRVPYTYYLAPQVSAVSPSAGPKASNTLVAVLSGANFRNDLGGPWCRFGGAGRVLANFITDRNILCQIPAVPLGKLVLVEVSLNGQEFEDHNSQTYTFLGQAPVLDSVQLSPAYTSIDLAFDVHTDRGGLSGSFACTSALSLRADQLSTSLSAEQLAALGPSPSTEAALEALFGAGSVCRFADNRTLSVVLGAMPAVRIGQALELRGGVLMRGGEVTYFAEGNATLRAPTSPPKPEAVLSAPSEIGKCARLLVDASGSTGGAGRSMYYTWSLDQTRSLIVNDNFTPQEKAAILAGLSARLQQFVGFGFDLYGTEGVCRNDACQTGNGTWFNCYCNGVDLDMTELPRGDYVFSLQLTNWLNANSDPAVFTVTKTLLDIPQVVINNGGTRSVFVNASVTYTSAVLTSSCSGDQVGLRYRWSIAPADGAAQSALRRLTTDRNSFSIPPFTLQPGTAYTLALQVHYAWDTSLTAADATTVVAAVSPPVAHIVGGERQASASQELTLDGSASFHPDFAPAAQSEAGLQFGWSCRATGLAGLALACVSAGGQTLFGASESALLQVPAGSMDPAAVAYYDFQLNVTASGAAGGLWALSAVRVHPAAAAVPAVTVLEAEATRAYPWNRRISLTSTVTPLASEAAMHYQWSTVAGDMDVAAAANILSVNSQDAALVVRPYRLTPGSSYTVRLTVTQGGAVGFDQLTLLMDTPPTGGFLTVRPTSGHAMSTEFVLSAGNWAEDAEALPLRYQFEYFEIPEFTAQTAVSRSSIVRAFAQTATAASTLPLSTAGDGRWGLQLRIQNALGSETFVTSCNMEAGLCAVEVGARSYGSREEFYVEVEASVAAASDHIANGDFLSALEVLLLALSNLAGATAVAPARRLLQLSSADLDMAARIRCNVVAPTILTALPSDLIGYPDASALAAVVTSSMRLLYIEPTGTNHNCTRHLLLVLDVVMPFLAADPAEPVPTEVVADMADALDWALLGAQHHLEAQASGEAAGQLPQVLVRHKNLTALTVYGSEPGESSKTLDSPLASSQTSRRTSPVVRTGAGRRQMHGTAEEWGGAGRGLLTTLSPGSTAVPAVTETFGQSVLRMPALTLPFAIDVLPCTVTAAGQQACAEPSVTVSVTNWKNLFNPLLHAPPAEAVIAPVLAVQVEAFGLGQVLPMQALSADLTLELQLSYAPDATQDARGLHRVAACVAWDGAGWAAQGCVLSEVRAASVTGTELVAVCRCNRTAYHTVLDVPAGCDGVPYSTTVYDACRKCGGDNSSCVGCDQVVGSGKVLDACDVCGGDNSSCTGCDGQANSRAAFDSCGVCGGDNSSCTGCDGVAVHESVSARTGVFPTTVDACGVCGGCDASCRGCDGVPNSNKELDKCNRCGPFDSPGPGQYSVASKDNCTLGRKQCPAGSSPDLCADCLPLGDALRGERCRDCEGIPRLFGAKQRDACGLCGGDGCSCTDCAGVVGGGARRDRCGVCEGDNACLDCFGVPFGGAVVDVCGICGGPGDPAQCTGCDGRLVRRPDIPPYFDRSSPPVCCPAALHGCDGICGASVGCDDVCSTEPKAVDSCGVCGGRDEPNTGTCDCAATPFGTASIGCDGECTDPPARLDKCGVCGGAGEKETGYCDCAGVPYGTSQRDAAGECCYVSDMGCSDPPRCWSGKTFDACGTCGGDGGTCLQPPTGAARHTAPWRSVVFVCFLFAWMLARRETERN